MSPPVQAKDLRPNHFVPILRKQDDIVITLDSPVNSNCCQDMMQDFEVISQMTAVPGTHQALHHPKPLTSCKMVN